MQQAAAAAQAGLSSNCSAECEGPGAPAVVRKLRVELTLPQARLHGEVVSDGDSFLRERGACVGPSPAPTFCIPGNLPVVGTFATSIPTPALGAVYYARAYALTRAGKVYGQDIQFRAVFPGSPFEGGVVFHVDPDGMHGLIAAPVNQSTFSQWWDSVNHGPAMSTGATGTAVGTGAANTTAIVTALGAGNYAAKLCADLDLDGFSDWYLPSKDELNLMYVNRDAIGNLNEAGYWSSSEEVGTIVWIQNLGSGDVSTTESTMNNAVRAIRAFGRGRLFPHNPMGVTRPRGHKAWWAQQRRRRQDGEDNHLQTFPLDSSCACSPGCLADRRGSSRPLLSRVKHAPRIQAALPGMP